jgi:membrane-associated phospholipid phosphatase
MPKRAKIALLAAGAGVVLLALTWYLESHVGVFRRADAAIFRGFAPLHTRPRLYVIANFVAHLCSPERYVYLAPIPILIALVRRRPRLAVAVGAILLGANVTTHLLKPLLASPRPPVPLTVGLHMSSDSWPSGHATAAMALALSLVLASPSRWRPRVAALGAAFSVAVCYSFLTLGWHYPSDVLGGFLVATTWTLLVVAAFFASDVRWPRRELAERREKMSIGHALGPPAAALLGAVVLAGLVALARPHEVVAYARDHEAFTLGAAGIALLGWALATGITLALRRFR